jgi:hypothetical protein
MLFMLSMADLISLTRGLFLLSKSSQVYKGGQLVSVPLKALAALRMSYSLKKSFRNLVTLPASKAKSMDTYAGTCLPKTTQTPGTVRPSHAFYYMWMAG